MAKQSTARSAERTVARKPPATRDRKPQNLAELKPPRNNPWPGLTAGLLLALTALGAAIAKQSQNTKQKNSVPVPSRDADPEDQLRFNQPNAEIQFDSSPRAAVGRTASGYNLQFNPEQTFQHSLKMIFAVEGGFTPEQGDGMGDTNFGITEGTLRLAQRSGINNLPRSVRQIDKDKAADIYRQMYWDRCDCDRMAIKSPKLAVLLFNSTVNFGQNLHNQDAKGGWWYLRKAINEKLRSTGKSPISTHGGLDPDFERGVRSLGGYEAVAETLQEFLSDYYSNHRKANSEWTGLLDRSALVNVYANLASNPEKAVDVLETAMQDANISSINPATSARAKRALLCYEAISNFIHDLVDNNSQLEQVDGILNGGRAAIESLQRIIRTTPDGDFGPGSLSALRDFFRERVKIK